MKDQVDEVMHDLWQRFDALGKVTTFQTLPLYENVNLIHFNICYMLLLRANSSSFGISNSDRQLKIAQSQRDHVTETLVSFSEL